MEQLKRENADLTEKLEQLLAVNQQLRDSNLLLEGKCETLLEDLSVKEARWTQREEELKDEVCIMILILAKISLSTTMEYNLCFDASLIPRPSLFHFKIDVFITFML